MFQLEQKYKTTYLFIFLTIININYSNSQIPGIPPINSDTIVKITTNPLNLIGLFKEWLFGPDATLTVNKLNETNIDSAISTISSFTSFFGLSLSGIVMNVEPLWSQFTLGFPLLGLEGVLVESDPFDACSFVEEPPKELTPEEEIIEIINENGTLSKNLNWFLIASDENCDLETKSRFAQIAGYTLLILRSINGTIIERVENDTNFNDNFFNSSQNAVFVCTIDDAHGLLLQLNYSYPKPYTASIKDLRNLQWGFAFYKLIGIFAASSVAVAGVGLVTYKIVKDVKVRALKKSIVLKNKMLGKIANSVPTTLWKFDLLNPNTRCNLCHNLFDHGDEIKKLECSHIFHDKCLIQHIISGKPYCPLCRDDLSHFGEYTKSNSSEKTPLLSSHSSSKNGENKQKYHCHICEILGMPLNEDFGQISSTLSPGGTARHDGDRKNSFQSHLHVQIPSVQRGLTKKSSITTANVNNYKSSVSHQTSSHLQESTSNKSSNE